MTTGLDGKGWGDTDKGVWIGAKTYGAQQLQAYSFFDGQKTITCSHECLILVE